MDGVCRRLLPCDLDEELGSGKQETPAAVGGRLNEACVFKEVGVNTRFMRPARGVGAVVITMAALCVLGVGTLAQAPAPNRLIPIDVRLPSSSTGEPDGTLAVRVHTPAAGSERYPDGAPVVVWVLGGFEVKGINHGLPPEADDVICMAFIGY